jgi:hypothetical protein
MDSIELRRCLLECHKPSTTAMPSLALKSKDFDDVGWLVPEQELIRTHSCRPGRPNGSDAADGAGVKCMVHVDRVDTGSRGLAVP